MELEFSVRFGMLDEHVLTFEQIICWNDRIKLSLLFAGFHLEGPFISKEKKGAHPVECVRSFQDGGIEALLEVYGSLDNVAIVTLAPELASSESVVKELTQRGITVSLGDYGSVFWSGP